MKDLPPDVPRLNPLPFVIADALLLGAAAYIRSQAEDPLTGTPLITISLLVALAAAAFLYPFVVNHARRQEEALQERANQIEALARTLGASAEQIGIAVANLPAIADSSTRQLRAAEQLPAALQTQLNALQQQLAATAHEQNAALRHELDTLRSSETINLAAALQNIARATQDLSRLEALTAKHTGIVDDALTRLPLLINAFSDQATDTLRRETANAVSALEAATESARIKIDATANATQFALAAAADQARIALETAVRDAVATLPTVIHVTAIPLPARETETPVAGTAPAGTAAEAAVIASLAEGTPEAARVASHDTAAFSTTTTATATTDDTAAATVTIGAIEITEPTLPIPIPEETPPPTHFAEPSEPTSDDAVTLATYSVFGAPAPEPEPAQEPEPPSESEAASERDRSASEPNPISSEPDPIPPPSPDPTQRAWLDDDGFDEPSEPAPAAEPIAQEIELETAIATLDLILPPPSLETADLPPPEPPTAAEAAELTETTPPLEIKIEPETALDTAPESEPPLADTLPEPEVETATALLPDEPAIDPVEGVEAVSPPAEAFVPPEDLPALPFPSLIEAPAEPEPEQETAPKTEPQATPKALSEPAAESVAMVPAIVAPSLANTAAASDAAPLRANISPPPSPPPTPEPITAPAPEEDAEPLAPESVLSSDGFTRLVATAYIGIGNRLFIRGDGPGLRRDKGVALQFISIGKWRWESAELLFPARVRLYKNDQIECAALGEFDLEPGHHHEVTATF